MKIAFVSYEYLPDTGFGGIATYVWHAARMLAQAGHHVEVVCGSPHREGTEAGDGLVVSRVNTGTCDGWQFGPLAAKVLEARHRAIGGFDVIESPEYRAEGAEFLSAHPEVPLVVKLHTPSYLIGRLSRIKFGVLRYARFLLGAVRRGRMPCLPGREDPRPAELEHRLALAADWVAAPSADIARVVGGDWGLPRDRTSTFPLPFESPGDLTAVPPLRSGAGERIVFVGRLEPRKGVQHLPAALRIVRKRFPNITLRCVGKVSVGPFAGESMDAYMKRKAGSAAGAIDFAGPQPRERLAAELAAADVCVFPSLWENFPYACLEAMTAGRAIIGSSAGGMAEMLADGAGVLVAPGDPRRWAAAIESLLADGNRRRQLGEVARARVLSQYSYTNVLATQVACYTEAIRYRRARGSERPRIPPRP